MDRPGERANIQPRQRRVKLSGRGRSGMGGGQLAPGQPLFEREGKASVTLAANPPDTLRQFRKDDTPNRTCTHGLRFWRKVG